MQGQAGARGEQMVKGTLWVPEVSMQDIMRCDTKTPRRRHQEPTGLHCSPRAVVTLYTLHHHKPASSFLPSLVTPLLLAALGFNGGVFIHLVSERPLASDLPWHPGER